MNIPLSTALSLAGQAGDHLLTGDTPLSAFEPEQVKAARDLLFREYRTAPRGTWQRHLLNYADIALIELHFRLIGLQPNRGSGARNGRP